MLRLKNPSWINVSLLNKTSLSEWDDQYIGGIANRIKKIQSNNPIVSIVIIAYNEETNIIRCIDSFSNLQTKYPLEIIVVDNNSSDKTAEVTKRLGVKYVFQKIQGCGISRQLGLEQAVGKYILTGDADTLYPPQWVNEMMKKLKKSNVACVYGRYSFISDEITPRWKLTLYETFSDLFVLIKAFKRPHLNAYGMTMGFVKEFALKVGYVETNIRGEDGRLAFDLMKFGKVKSVMTNSSRVWTGTRTISKDGKLINALKNRIIMALANIGSYFRKTEDHDTKSSPNQTADYAENVQEIKRKMGLKK
jgi:glycosyltransferase involved in cell wall biosynthesis